jgi:N-acetyl-anhydromuramyl-L-alanine amidase AmpD
VGPGFLVVAGERVPCAVPVVHWFDPGGYDAYDTRPGTGDDPPVGLRYRPGRAIPDGLFDEETTERLRRGQGTREELAGFVDQFVIHYDVCGTSQVCFRVLEEYRGLSVHFMCDLDGTLYQTLDLADQAWHAAKANARSVGVEVAQIGAYRPGSDEAAARLGEWYEDQPDGTTAITLPARFGDGGLRAPERATRTATPGKTEGAIHGEPLEQYDFTAAQYESLAALAAALHEALPGIVLDVPREPDGTLMQRALTDDEYDGYAGLLGHYHVTTRKTDPGPAFRWELLCPASTGPDRTP